MGWAVEDMDLSKGPRGAKLHMTVSTADSAHIGYVTFEWSQLAKAETHQHCTNTVRQNSTHYDKPMKRQEGIVGSCMQPALFCDVVSSFPKNVIVMKLGGL